MYEKTLTAGWRDMDSNAHMANTAYLDMAVDVRMSFIADSGFPLKEFAVRRIGPVVARDEIEYFREFSLLESVRVTLELAGMSDDGSRFIMRNEFFRADGKLAARLNSTGGWFDLAARRITAPPDELLRAMRSMTRTADFQTLPSSLQ